MNRYALVSECITKAGNLSIYNYQIHENYFFLPKIQYSIIFREYQNVYEYTSCVDRALMDHALITLVSLKFKLTLYIIIYLSKTNCPRGTKPKY